MNDYEKVKQSLEVIEQNGDLFDTIALREGVLSDTTLKRKFVKANILFFSRILYGGVMVYEKIRALFSPIQKVKEAQEQIREVLGVNIDVVKSKSWISSIEKKCFSKEHSEDAKLAIFYEENGEVSMEEYVENLRRILQLCDLHKIQEILLREDDVIDLFPGVNLESFLFVSMKQLFNYEEKPTTDCNNTSDFYDIETEIKSSLLVLNPEDLRNLIHQLEVFKIDKKKILSLSENITDQVIKNAVNQFLMNGNLKLLTMTVNQRLMYIMNSDSSYKDRTNGKVFQTVTIKDQFVKIVSTNSNGEIIGNSITDLYNYLGILNYQMLLGQADFKSDNQELLRICALYLYLCQGKNNVSKKKNDSQSFYDYIYKMFQEKKAHKRKVVPGLYTTSDKYIKQIVNFFIGMTITAGFLVMVYITGLSYDLFQQYCLGNKNSSVSKNVIEWILTPHIRSLEFEYNHLKDFFGKIRDLDFDFGISNNITGESKNNVNSNTNSDRIVAKVTSFTEDPLPIYFANKYATSAFYEKGQVNYWLENNYIDFSEIEEVESLFSVEYRIPKSSLEDAMVDDQLFLRKLYYPVGDNYVITNIVIKDFNNQEIEIKIYPEGEDRFISYPNFYNSPLEALHSIENPQIFCTYGISKYLQNGFVEDLKKENSYTEYPSEEIRKAIISGLGLEVTASDYEIFSAIKSRLYSLTPIEDAGLSGKIERLDERDFYETVASMDSLICNLAATLAVGVDEELIYTVGFYNADDMTITESEAHAWAMNSEGQVIDVTPVTEKEKNFIEKIISLGHKNDSEQSFIMTYERQSSSTISAEEKDFMATVLSWCLKNRIPQTVVMALIVYLNYKLFGKRIKFHIEVKKLEKIFMEEDFETNYAKMKETMYDGIHVPVSRNLAETLDVVSAEFSGFTKEDLKELRRQLKQSDLNTMELKTALKLIDQLPFIREHSDEIQKVFQKKFDK